MSEIGIGSTVWLFSENYREYEKDGNGRSKGGPIWIKHWRPFEIVGETRVSWILSCRSKVPKKRAHGVAFSWAEVQEQEWVHVHRYRIERMVGLSSDPAILRQIAALVGYEPEVTA